MGQAALITVGLMYVACLGFSCLTLALSSRTPSTLAVFLTDVVLVVLTGLVPSAGVGVLERALALFPINFANFSVLFSALESYPLGPVVLDLIGMVLDPCGGALLQETPGGVAVLLLWFAISGSELKFTSANFARRGGAANRHVHVRCDCASVVLLGHGRTRMRRGV